MFKLFVIMLLSSIILGCDQNSTSCLDSCKNLGYFEAAIYYNECHCNTKFRSVKFLK